MSPTMLQMKASGGCSLLEANTNVGDLCLKVISRSLRLSSVTFLPSVILPDLPHGVCVYLVPSVFVQQLQRSQLDNVLTHRLVFANVRSHRREES